jgi:hypothetical protein
MTPTREQLAAKAAGIVIHHWIGDEPRVVISEPNAKYEQYKPWQPVTNKSDSFDLMVAGKINIQHLDELGRVFAGDGSTLQMEEYKDHATEADATMWAAFLCAIKTGRAM